MINGADVRLAASLGHRGALAVFPDEPSRFSNVLELVERIIRKGRLVWIRVALNIAERVLPAWQEHSEATIYPTELVEAIQGWLCAPSDDGLAAVQTLTEQTREVLLASPPERAQTPPGQAANAALGVLHKAGQVVTASETEAGFLLVLLLSGAMFALGVAARDGRMEVDPGGGEHRVLLSLAESLLPGLVENEKGPDR